MEHTKQKLENDRKKIEVIQKFLSAPCFIEKDFVTLRMAGLDVTADTLNDHDWHPELKAFAGQLYELVDDEWAKLSELSDVL